MSPLTRQLPWRDRLSLALLISFILTAFTIELYWLLNHNSLPALAETQILARMFRAYSAGDRRFFDLVTPLPVALEVINIYFTQLLNIWLVFAILRDRPYRHPLQLVIGSYVAYSVILYFVEAHCSGYAAMLDKSAWGFFLFYAPNLPWLLGHIYLGTDSFLAMTRQAKR